MNKSKALVGALAGLILTLPVSVQAGKPVGITADIMAVSVNHNGAATDITRTQDNANTVNPAFGKTSRPLPAILHPAS